MQASATWYGCCGHRQIINKHSDRGCRTPDRVSGPLYSTSADLTSIFIAKANKITEIICDYSFLQLMKCRCYWSRRDSQIKTAIIVQNEVTWSYLEHDVGSVRFPLACAELIHKHWQGRATAPPDHHHLLEPP